MFLFQRFQAFYFLNQAKLEDFERINRLSLNDQTLRQEPLKMDH